MAAVIDRRRDSGELRGDDGGRRDGAGRDAAVDDAPRRETSAGDRVDCREKIRHRRRPIGGGIVLGLTSEQQPVPRNALVGLAPVLVAPLVAEAAPLPDVERDRVVVVAVTGLGRLAKRAAGRRPHHVDPERRQGRWLRRRPCGRAWLFMPSGSAAISLSYFAMITSHE